jgi:class 3 adenylate cyclase
VPKTNKMDKVLTFPRPEEALSDVGPGMLDRANRTFICTVLFLDIIEYAKKPVSQQLRVKEQFNARLSEALQDIATNDRIILDTGDGAAINFLGDPEDALFVAMSLAQVFTHPLADALPVDVRIGINLGPVRLVRDINGQPNIIGDGINVAERVMSFGGSGQVLVSRSYFEVVTRISEDYAQLFAYQGSRTDKHVREHEIYAVASSGTEALDVATRRHRARPTTRPELKLVDSAQVGDQSQRGWQHTIKLPYAVATLSCLALMGALVYYASDRAIGHASNAPKFAPAIPAVQPSHAAAPTVSSEAPRATTETPSAGPTQTAPEHASIEARPSPVGVKKPPVARKDAGQPPVAAEAAPAPVPVEVKTPASEPTAATPSVTPWHPTQAAPASNADVAPGSPYTAAAPKGPTALVMLAVSPWGEVLVDGKSMGVSPPLSELELTPGAHRVEIRNGDFTPHLVLLQLESNQTIRIKHKFTQR